MDHSEVRELLEDAAVEPGGLERLMAGDTSNATLVAGHLAGCPECTEELERLRRSVGVIRPAVRAVPPPELRQRTLDYVAAVGRPRGSDPAAVLPGAGPDRDPLPEPVVASRRGVGRLWATATIAAALIVAVTGTTLLVNGRHDSTERGQAAEIEALGDVARWTLRIDGQADAERIVLASATGAKTSGTLIFSPTTAELAVVVDALAPPPAGHEYRCWVEIDGRQASIGRMFFGGALAYWVGPVSQVAGLKPGARFGISLVDLTGTDASAQPVLVSGD